MNKYINKYIKKVAYHIVCKDPDLCVIMSWYV